MQSIVCVYSVQIYSENVTLFYVYKLSILAKYFLLVFPFIFQSEVVKERSTHSISLPLCMFNFLCAVEWTLYGLAINDQFVTVSYYVYYVGTHIS